MQSLQVPMPSEEQLFALREIYRTTRTVRLRSRAQMVLLAIEQHLSIAQIAVIVRSDGATVRRWLKRWMDEGIDGLANRRGVGAGAAAKLTRDYEELLLASVRLRPRALGQEFSLWPLGDWLSIWINRPGFMFPTKVFARCLRQAGSS